MPIAFAEPNGRIRSNPLNLDRVEASALFLIVEHGIADCSGRVAGALGKK